MITLKASEVCEKTKSVQANLTRALDTLLRETCVIVEDRIVAASNKGQYYINYHLSVYDNLDGVQLQRRLALELKHQGFTVKNTGSAKQCVDMRISWKAKKTLGDVLKQSVGG